MKKSSIILKVIVGLIFLLAFAGMYMVATAGADNSPEMASATAFLVNLTVGLLIVAGVLVVISSVFTMINHPSKLKNALIGLAVFGVFFALAYFLASDAQVFGANGDALLKGDVASVSKWSGTGLNLSYLLLAIGGVFFVFDLLKSLIKS